MCGIVCVLSGDSGGLTIGFTVECLAVDDDDKDTDDVVFTLLLPLRLPLDDEDDDDILLPSIII